MHNRLHTAMRPTLRGAIVITAIAEILEGDILYGTYCLIVLALTTALTRLALRADTPPPIAIDLVLLWLLVSDMTLGNLFGLYLTWPWYDKVLHSGNSILIGLLGFLVVYVVHVTGRLRSSPWLDAVAILLITIGLGAIWEIAEYAVDRMFGRATQGAPGLAPRDDTMLDLVLDGAGAIVAAIVGPLYMRRSKRNRRRVRAIAKFLAERAPA